MKKNFLSILSAVIFLILFTSCFHNHNVSISISDNADEYEMDASYRKNQTHQVRVYLNEHLLNASSSMTKNKSIDEEITLDDNTRFYINAHPGELSIKIDKSENTAESCEKVRQVCEELKDILADN